MKDLRRQLLSRLLSYFFIKNTGNEFIKNDRKYELLNENMVR